MVEAAKQGENPQNPTERPVDAIEKMRQAGIDPNEVVSLMVPVIEQVVMKTVEGLNLSKTMEAAVNARADQIANQVIAQLNARADEAEKAAHEQAAQIAPARTTAGNTGGLSPDNPMMQAIFGKLLGVGGSSAGDGGLDQMAKLASSWGNVMKAIMQPVVEMQATMRQNLLSEMATYSKTGGIMPWERDNATGTMQPERRVANLNQEELKIIAQEVANRIRLT